MTAEKRKSYLHKDDYIRANYMCVRRVIQSFCSVVLLHNHPLGNPRGHLGVLYGRLRTFFNPFCFAEELGGGGGGGGSSTVVTISLSDGFLGFNKIKQCNHEKQNI